MENTFEKIRVYSTMDCRVGVSNPDIPFRHVWTGKNTYVDIKREIIDQLIYGDGFMNMLENGILEIKDLEAKKALGLEPEDAKQSVNLVTYTDADRKRLLNITPLKEFKQIVTEMKPGQVLRLADYAIQNKIADFEKAKIIKQLCGKDVIKAIQLEDAAKED